ncbi:hypothetical protein CN585_16035 [Bacillus toyonensis]|uniref:Uncharacterized protein n=1 Tax=Bacillus toyonensis TaxID=155322 RepID=A0A2A8HDI3_9BACI|nr:hypothetical protein CN585_16035 [Bacillus toyonensis]
MLKKMKRSNEETWVVEKIFSASYFCVKIFFSCQQGMPINVRNIITTKHHKNVIFEHPPVK